MKILRIETVNLNSLYGSQGIDLEASLSGASLFLIHGPTGSGKSTLMDAVSLALFGVTPRLNAEHGEPTADPRTIMSRGAGECSAAVVFSKLEPAGRRTYRAAWSCRRARKSPEGELQPAERSLERLEPDGTRTLLVSSKTKKELEPVFSQVLEQFGVRDFNRSMLLAQGRFDAFVSAQPDERAEILERLTDTSVYQQLGERAARVHRSHSSRLQALRMLAAVGGGLEPAELARLEQEHEANRAALDRSEQLRAQAAACLEWLDAEQALGAALALAEQERADVTRETERAQGDLELLEQYERCEQERAFYWLDAHRSTQATLVGLDGELEQIGVTLPERERAAEDAEQSAAAAATRQRGAAAQLEILRPLAHAADRAESAYQAAVKLVAETGVQRADTAERVEEARAAHLEAGAALAQSTAAATQARAALATREPDAQLAASWGPTRSRLDQLVTMALAVGRDEQALESTDALLARDRALLDADRAAHEGTRAQAIAPLRDEAERAAALRAALIGERSFDEARRDAIAAIERERDTLARIGRAIPAVAAARRAADEVQSLVVQTESHREALARAEDEVRARAHEQERAAEIESVARSSLDRIRLVAELGRHRQELAQGEPCPLCGSTDHPYLRDAGRAEDDAAIGETVAAAARTLDEAAAACAAAKELTLDAKGCEREIGARLDLLEKQLVVAAAERERLEQQARALLEGAALPTETSGVELDEALAQAARRSEECDQALVALDDAERALERTRQAERDATAALAQVEASLRERDAALGARAAQLAAARAELVDEQAATALERAACQSLLEPFGLTVDAAEPAVWRDRGDARVREHEASVRAAAALDAEVATQAAEQAGRAALLAEREAQLAELDARLTYQQQALSDARMAVDRERALLVRAWQQAATGVDARPDGLPPADASSAVLLASAGAWLAEASAKASDAESARQRALDVLTAARTRQSVLLEQRARAVAAVVEARRSLDGALAALSLPSDEALAARRLDDETLVRVRALRAALTERTLAAEVRVRERRSQAEAHARIRPESLPAAPSRDELTAELERATAQCGDASRAHQATGDRLRDHRRATDEQERRRNALREAEAEARIWQALHERIGVRDGGRFRQFAQALNLGALLERANAHLGRLANRYELTARYEGSLPTLEFDLRDLWQAGERVAPRALSGGERFLVSLALALGLSDFRKVRMPIETLLLDEGFGTLDPDTLSVALGALSQLQADGRQVGIISHVAGLRDRIEARFEVRPLGAGRSVVLSPRATDGGLHPTHETAPRLGKTP